MRRDAGSVSRARARLTGAGSSRQPISSRKRGSWIRVTHHRMVEEAAVRGEKKDLLLFVG